MKYSIIIPCFNEAHVLSKTLDSIQRVMVNRSDVEILLMDNGSTDGSQALALGCGAIVIETPNVRISALRNLGAKSARGRYLLFLDADIAVATDWLNRLDQYTDPDNQADTADVVGFVDDVPATAPWYAKIWGLRASARRHRLMEIDSLPGRNIFVDRPWFEKVNGFSETLITGEDKDFVMRLKKAGAKVLSDPSVDMTHLGYERTFQEWVRKEYWRQHSHVALIKGQGMSLRLLRFPIIAMSHVLLALIILGSVITSQTGIALGLLVVSLVPSLLLSIKSSVSRFPVGRMLQFTLLYWLRFHVAGWSVVIELIERKSIEA
ncbi:hypothetical protein A9Q99_23885 [Gammaproteobacteria bacterium 45_16_T64]|nr:hypothetical protein A9Q99_23885 [Gammaproteobacteria bacterium 45_16_T64]